MSGYTPVTSLDLILEQFETADQHVTCSALPANFFEACWPVMWTPDTVIAAGSMIRPPVDNGQVYETVAGGTTGSGEPPWSLTAGESFLDGTITWITHNNYSLAKIDLDPADKIIEDNEVDDGGGGTVIEGRRLVIAQKLGAISHRSGTVTHNALINTATKTLERAVDAETTEASDNDIVGGRYVVFKELRLASKMV